MSLDEVLRAVQEHGLKVLLGMVTTGLAGCAAWAKNQFAWRRTINAAMLAVLHDRLFAERVRTYCKIVPAVPLQGGGSVC